MNLRENTDLLKSFPHHEKGFSSCDVKDIGGFCMFCFAGERLLCVYVNKWRVSNPRKSQATLGYKLLTSDDSEWGIGLQSPLLMFL